MRTLRCGRCGKKAHLLKEEPSGKVHRISHFRISAVPLKEEQLLQPEGRRLRTDEFLRFSSMPVSQVEELRQTQQSNQSNSDLTQM
jgi:hypothetical protein